MQKRKSDKQYINYKHAFCFKRCLNRCLDCDAEPKQNDKLFLVEDLKFYYCPCDSCIAKLLGIDKE